MAQIQPKSQFLFHKNLPPRDFSIMTLSAGAAPNSQEDPADRNSSHDSLYENFSSNKDLAGKKADYSHVQSKVRQYIHSGNGSSQSRPSSKQQNYKNVDYGKSFVLSAGRKSFSMSNILVDDLDNYPPQRRNSCKSKLKSFLSAKNLNDLHVSVKNSANFEALIPTVNPNPQNPKHFLQKRSSIKTFG